MENGLMNMQKACKYVHRSEDTLRKAIKNKEIPCIYFRGGYLFSKLALDLWVLGLNYEEIKEKIIKMITKEMIYEVVKTGN